MGDDRFEGGAPPPIPPQPPAPPQPPHPPVGFPPPAPPGPVGQPQVAQQAWAPPEPLSDGKQGGRSTLFKVLVALGVLLVLPILALLGIVAFAFVGASGSDSEDIGEPVAIDDLTAAEDDLVDDLVVAEPTTPDGVGIEWDAAPTECDGNRNRGFTAWVDNTTSDDLELRMRILDLDGRFIHQSHVYFAPASGLVQVDLAGIPPGQSLVQIITESDDRAIGQIDMTFDGC